MLGMVKNSIQQGPVVQSIVSLTMLLSKVFIKCMKKFYSKYTNMNVVKYQDLFMLFKLQAITFTNYQCL